MTAYILILITFLIQYINTIQSYNYPKCSDCKWFISNTKVEAFGQCKFFYKTQKINNKEFFFYNYAIDCRHNHFMCGKFGNEFIPKYNINSEDMENYIDNNLKELKNELNEIKENSQFGEGVEEDEIKEYEEKILEISRKLDIYKNLNNNKRLS